MNLLQAADVVKLRDVLRGYGRESEAINRVERRAMVLQIHHRDGLEIGGPYALVDALQVGILEILAPHFSELKDLPKFLAVVEGYQVGSVPVLRVPEIDRATVGMTLYGRGALDHCETAHLPAVVGHDSVRSI